MFVEEHHVPRLPRPALGGDEQLFRKLAIPDRFIHVHALQLLGQVRRVRAGGDGDIQPLTDVTVIKDRGGV